MPGSEAAREEFVMDVVVIGDKNWLPAKKAAHDGKPDIKKRNSKDHQWRGQAKQCGRLLRPYRAEAPEQESKGQAATVAAEGTCGGEIEAKEAQQGTGQRHNRQGHSKVVIRSEEHTS